MSRDSMPTGATLPPRRRPGLRRKALTWVADKIALSFDDPARVWEQLGSALCRWDDEIDLPQGSYLNGSPNIYRYPSPTEERITVGRYCSIANDVSIVLSGNHRSDWVTTSPLPVLFGLSGFEGTELIRGRGGITIGNDVWIGRGAMVMSGSVIGDGAVIGARAQVSGSVRPYAVVAGNPAREIRRRFTDSQVERLLALRWWDLPSEAVKAAIPLLCSPDIERALAELAPAGRPRAGGAHAGQPQGDQPQGDQPQAD